MILSDTDICIIGGGVIGLCSAYYLNKAGYRVTVMDRGNMDRGASHVNAGYVTPSHIIPLSAPGMPAKGLRYMFNPDSPFYLKPRMERELTRWAWLFYRNSTPVHVDRCAPLLKQFNQKSKELYESLAEEEGLHFGYAETGLLKLCQTRKKLEADQRAAEFARKQGLKVRELSRKEVHDMEPSLPPRIEGAIYYTDDALLIPQDFMNQLKQLLERKGVHLLPGTPARDLVYSNGRPAAVKTGQGQLSFNHLLMAAGAWTPDLVNLLGRKMFIQAGKGYCFEMQNPGINYPAILSEANVAVSPMGGKLRLGGTMELAGLNESINRRRVRAIRRAVEKYYPSIKIEEGTLANAQSGLRPVSPDGMPYIGRLNGFDNVLVAAGHAMMGMSLGPATGLLIGEIVQGKEPFIPIRLFNPNRFGPQ